MNMHAQTFKLQSELQRVPHSLVFVDDQYEISLEGHSDTPEPREPRCREDLDGPYGNAPLQALI
jgi:hypothetical protein